MLILLRAGRFGRVGPCLLAIVFLALEVRARLHALEESNSDNTQWNMMQTEVEVLRLQAAVREARHPLSSDADPAAALDEVRRWFNIFYSRIAMLQGSAFHAPQIARPEYSADITVIRDFLDGTVSAIDGTDAALAVKLVEMEAALPAVRAAARSMTMRSLSDFATQSDMQRVSMSETLVRLAVLTGGLILVLGALALGMGRLWRTSSAQAAALTLTGGRLSTIVDNSADAIVVTDRDGVIQEFNPAARAIFGFGRAEALGQNALRLLFAEGEDGGQRAALVAALDETVMAGRGPLRIVVDGRRADGSIFPAEVSIALTRPTEERLIVAFVRDISDRLRADERLQAALERAVAGEKTKAEFLAVMSHEMRTPLNGLIGSMQLLRDTDLSPAQHELLAVMSTSGEILLSHVNSVLDISRAEAGVIRIAEAPFDLDRLVEDAVANQAGLAAASGNTLEVTPVTGPLGLVTGDADRLRQILLNLIGNAVKFTVSGAIVVETERLRPAQPGQTGHVEIRVIDTGIGISEEDLDRIFEDFVTLDTSYGRKTSGTGLGLGIARRLTEAMGGEIGAESEPGEGSLFWVRLPLPPAAHGAAAPERPAPAALPDRAQPEADGPPLRVLVVEDNEINRFLLRRYLETAGHSVTEAVDGAEGVQAASERRFDVILMDISMPRMDGVQATRRIREGGASARSRLLALTAHALPEELERFRLAGVDGCLTKPIGRPELLAALSGRVALPPPPAPLALEPLVDPVSISDLRGQIGAATAAGLLRRVIIEGDRIHADLPRLLAAGDLDQVARLCHQLAGTCGTFGTRRLRRHLVEAEHAAAKGDVAATGAALEVLPDLWQATADALADAVSTLERAA